MSTPKRTRRRVAATTESTPKRSRKTKAAPSAPATTERGSRPARTGNTAVNEALGVVLVGVGVLLLLALISYVPADVPSWVFFSWVSPPNEEISNYVGILGVLGAGFLYFLFGAASYLLAVLLLGFGIAKLFFPRFSLKGRLGWAFLFLICGASLLHIQPFFLQSWGDTFRIQSPGGWTGYYVGGKAFTNALGSGGSAIVLIVLYLASLILLTGFHPFKFVKLCAAAASGRLADRRERQRERLTEEELFAANQREIDRQAEKIEKRLRPKRATKTDPDPSDEPESVSATPVASDDPPLPEPKIIDTSVPKPGTKKLPPPLRAAKPPTPSAASRKSTSTTTNSPTSTSSTRPTTTAASPSTRPSSKPSRTSSSTPSPSSASPPRPATSPRAPPSPATRSTPPKASASTASSPSNATSPAPPAPSASTSSPPSPARTPSASKSPTRRR